MDVDAGGEGGDFALQLRERGRVAFGELADAAGEGLRHAVELALHGGGEGGQPLVLDDEGFEFVGGERGVAGGDLFFEGALGVFHAFGCGGLSRIKVSNVEIEKNALQVGDIVFGKSSVKRDGIGYPSQFLGCAEPVVCSGFTYRARARQRVANATFLFYALRAEQTRQWVIDNSQASALTNINQRIADAIPLRMPPSLPEQTAIAEVLSDMDEELAALETRLAKTRALKQGMMQSLLTGRIRLV